MEKQQFLVVDDEKNIRLTVSQALESFNCPVQSAINGEEALQKLGQEQFSIVFLDLKMPGIDGMEVLRRIRTGWPRTRVVIITAHGSIDSAVEAMKLGAVDFIQKPFSPYEIRELAAMVLHRVETGNEDAVDYQSLIELTRQRISEQNYEPARTSAAKAIAINPGRPEAYNLLGALSEINGDWLEAQKFYRAARDIDPTFKPAQANLERTTSLNKGGRIEIGSEKDSKDE